MSEADVLEVVVELSQTERRLAEGTVGLGAKVCFMRQHGLGSYMKMIGEIRMMTERDKRHYAIVHLDQRPEIMLRKAKP